MKKLSTRIAFWFSEVWAGFIGLVSLLMGVAAPFATPVYIEVNNLGPASMPRLLATSAVLIALGYSAYLVCKHKLSGVFIFSLLFTLLTIYTRYWLLWLLVVPIICLPYLLSYYETYKQSKSA